MKWLFWGTLLCLWFIACASTNEVDTPVTPQPHDDGGPPISEPDAKLPDVRPNVQVKPEAGPNDSSFVAPQPVVIAISPTKATAGGVGPTLVVNGNDFVSYSVVRADGADLPTTFVSETQLRAQLPSARIEDAGVIQIDVFTTPPGGGKSTTVGFLVENPVPVLTSISPTSVQVGASDMILTLNGTNFAKTAKVTFDGVDLVVNSASSTMVTATITAALLANAGSHAVLVSNPAPGGGKSASIAFTVTNPQSVSITTVSPTFTTLGSGDLQISIDGTGFVSGSQVSFNATNIPSTTTDQTHINATIPAALFSTAGSFPIVVTNPAPGGGVSNPVQFEVRNPAPTLSSLSPNTAYYGGADKKISVLGTGFVPSSVARVGGADVTTTYVSANQIDALVPAAKLAALGTLSIMVHTPGPGGGDSSAASLFVVCDSTGVDVGLGAVGNVTTVFTDFGSATSVKAMNSSVCPTTLATSRTPQPARTWVVQNNNAGTVTLSAYAVCSVGSVSEDDAFMAIYKRPTAPATDPERLQCATVMSEGPLGNAGDYRSPEANGSDWCPGLTKANGGGVALSACERAVVLITPYDLNSTVYTPPYAVRIKTE